MRTVYRNLTLRTRRHTVLFAIILYTPRKQLLYSRFHAASISLSVELRSRPTLGINACRDLTRCEFKLHEHTTDSEVQKRVEFGYSTKPIKNPDVIVDRRFSGREIVASSDVISSQTQKCVPGMSAENEVTAVSPTPADNLLASKLVINLSPDGGEHIDPVPLKTAIKPEVVEKTGNNKIEGI